MTKRIAIPSNHGYVNEHFGRSTEFIVYEISNNIALEIKKLNTVGLEHNHEGLTDLFANNNITALVCGGIGRGMIDSINSAGMDIVTGASGEITNIAKSYADGTLVSSGSSCQEHHH